MAFPAISASDRKALRNLRVNNLTDLFELNDHRGDCVMATQHPCQKKKAGEHHTCDHPVDKFRISDNSRRHIFCWLVAKLILGINTPVDNEDLMKVFWKIFDSTCANGHRGRNRHYVRNDGQVCVNPFHFRLDMNEARTHRVFFTDTFAEHELRFTASPLWQMTSETVDGVPTFTFSRVAAPAPLGLPVFVPTALRHDVPAQSVIYPLHMTQQRPATASLASTTPPATTPASSEPGDSDSEEVDVKPVISQRDAQAGLRRRLSAQMTGSFVPAASSDMQDRKRSAASASENRDDFHSKRRRSSDASSSEHSDEMSAAQALFAMSTKSTSPKKSAALPRVEQPSAHPGTPVSSLAHRDATHCALLASSLYSEPWHLAQSFMPPIQALQSMNSLQLLARASRLLIDHAPAPAPNEFSAMIHMCAVGQFLAPPASTTQRVLTTQPLTHDLLRNTKGRHVFSPDPTAKINETVVAVVG